MFKVTRMNIMTPEFKMAYMKLGDQPMKVATHMKYRQIATTLEGFIKTSMEDQKKLAEEFVAKDEKGEMIKKFDDEGKAIGFEWLNEEDANEAFKKFSLEELSVGNAHPFYMAELEDAKLTNSEWEALKEVIADPTNS